jgi:hypothetical protein
MSGAKKEMIRIGQDNLRASLTQFFGCHGLDRGLGTNRHEYRCINPAMGSCQGAEPGRAVPIRFYELEIYG